MTILNYKEKRLQIVYDRISDEEDRGCLLEAILSAIRWNSLCEDSEVYDADRLNVGMLVKLITNILKFSTYESKAMVIIFQTTAPREEKNNLLKALLAAVRWNGILTERNELEYDGGHLQVIATLMEAMIEECDAKNLNNVIDNA